MSSMRLDSAAEVYAIAQHYEREGDPELMRRVRARLASQGIPEAAVLARIEERAKALASEWTAE